jgi:2-oxoacid:acceptor oxidoreductase gamma subunit (pyruvate/2-ketoisovalerate family)
MDPELIEIKMHGFGGQGIVMATELFANVMSKAGYQVQSFSQYGAERRGGRVESYLRISRHPILVHSRVYEADYLVFASEEFIDDVHVMSSVKEGGVLLINCPRLPDTFSLQGRDVEVVVVDADRIAIRHGVRLPSGMPVVNTTMVGALVALFPDAHFDYLAEAMAEKGVPAVERNRGAAQEAFQGVQGQLRGVVVSEFAREEEVGVGERRVLRLQSRPSPCEVHCPVGVPVRRFVALMESGKFSEAWEEIKVEHPFPGICGRVCFHPCETACNRNEFDEGVALNALERAAFDYSGGGNVVGKRLRGAAVSPRKVAIIGSGPAGMSCAYFLRLLGYDVTVFEALSVVGGVPRVGIPAYRLPRAIIDKEMEQVVGLGVHMKTGVEVDSARFEEIMRTYDACFVAVGAHRPVRLDIPGEETEGVIPGFSFLKDVALGREVAIGGKVVVIGGGNTAVDAARTAKRLGAHEVVIIYRRSEEEMPAYRGEVEQAKEEGVQMLYLALPIRIQADRGGISGLECVRMQLLEQGDDGRRHVQPIEGTNFMVDAHSVIVAVGEAVEVPFLPDSVRGNGALVEVDFWGRTSVKGLFAGGDVTTFSRSVAHAIGSGKRAAVGIDVFLKGGDEEVVRVFEENGGGNLSVAEYMSRDFSARARGAISFADLHVEYFRKLPRARAGVCSLQTRRAHFDEVNLGLSRDAAREEAGRCFQCGYCPQCGNCYIFCPDIAIAVDERESCFTINHEVCKACGICVEECPRGVIQWESD